MQNSNNRRCERKKKKPASKSEIIWMIENCNKNVRWDMIDLMTEKKIVTFAFGGKKWRANQSGFITQTINNNEFSIIVDPLRQHFPLFVRHRFVHPCLH